MKEPRAIEVYFEGGKQIGYKPIIYLEHFEHYWKIEKAPVFDTPKEAIRWVSEVWENIPLVDLFTGEY